jgi:hypothetical protein
VAWNQTHEDPDIALDLVLLDQFLTNLTAHGAVADQGLATCPNGYDPNPPGYGSNDEGWGDEGRQRQSYACSTGRSGDAGWLLIAAALGLVLRRRARAPIAAARRPRSDS